ANPQTRATTLHADATISVRRANALETLLPLCRNRAKTFPRTKCATNAARQFARATWGAGESSPRVFPKRGTCAAPTFRVCRPRPCPRFLPTDNRDTQDTRGLSSYSPVHV